MRISVVGTGYVGLSLSCLLAQHNEVRALDIVERKVNLINQGISPIKDTEISAFLASGKLNLHAGLDMDWAYAHPDYVVIATPTDYDVKSRRGRCSPRQDRARHDGNMPSSANSNRAPH